MDILVVGGAGYIGAHVVLSLLERGHKVLVFDNLSLGHRENVPENAAFVEGDLLHEGPLERLLQFAHFDAVVHLAALKAAGDSMLEPERYSHHNLRGSLRLIELCSKAGIRNFLFSSSAAVFGDPIRLPIDEDHPTEPANFYGFTKLEVERTLAWYARLGKMRYASLRYFNAAGYDPKNLVPGREKDPKNLIPLVMEVAAGTRTELLVHGTDYPTPDGTCLRDYIHVSDLATAHALALDYLEREQRDLICCLGSERGASVLEVIEAARRITGRPIPSRFGPRRPGDPPELLASASRARALLGWVPEYSDLDTMLQTTWQLYNPEARPK